MEDVHIILAAPKEESIKKLLKSKGFIIGVDGGAELAIEESIELDLAIGDFDSVSSLKSLEIKKHAKKVINFPSKKDDTDAELALLYVKEHIEARKIYIYNWYGGRLDHLQSIMMMALQKRFRSILSKIEFVSKNNVASYYPPGKYELVKEEGMTYLSLILLTKIEKLSLDKVSYPLNGENYSSPRALISNEFKDKKANLSLKEGIVLMIQSRD